MQFTLKLGVIMTALAAAAEETCALKPVTLSGSGRVMPTVGMGLWKLDGRVSDVVADAVTAGYRHFDSACDYGNEEQVGKGLAKAMAGGKVSREDLFVTSKLWVSSVYASRVINAHRRTPAYPVQHVFVVLFRCAGVHRAQLHKVHDANNVMSSATPPHRTTCSEHISSSGSRGGCLPQDSR